MTPVKPKTKKVVSSKKAEKSTETKPINLELAVFDQEGQEVEKINLPPEIFGLKINKGLIKQAVEAQMSQSRIPYAHAKDRSEVSGGGKKPWRQKGTGRARHGSIRSPIWKGGGVTHGPRKEKNYVKKINKQMRRLALLMVLSGKARDNEILVLNDLKIDEPKTKLMANVVKKLNKVKSDLEKGALIAMAQKDEKIIRATRNIPKIDTIGVGSLNVVDLLSYKYLLMTKESIDVIKKTYQK
jgi:large subunit ribosomal protein L4